MYRMMPAGGDRRGERIRWGWVGEERMACGSRVSVSG
jgi:hypothetical protein